MTTLRRLLLIALVPLAACESERTPERALGGPLASAVCSPFQAPTQEASGAAPGSCEVPTAPSEAPEPAGELASLAFAECTLH